MNKDQTNPQQPNQQSASPPPPQVVQPQQATLPPQQNPQQPTQGQMPGPMPSQQVNQPMPSSGGSKNKLVLIAVIVVVMMALIVGAVLLLSGDDDIDGSGETETNNSVNSGETVDPQETIKDQDLQASFNERVELSNGIAITVTGTEENWQSQNPERETPSSRDGRTIVAVNLTIENLTAESVRFGGTDFTLLDQTGEDYIESYSNYQAEDAVMMGEDIPAGGSRTGQLIYPNVPVGSVLSFEYEESFYRYNANEEREEITVKATFK